MEMRNETAVNYNAGEEIAPIFEARICLKGNKDPGRYIGDSPYKEGFRDVWYRCIRSYYCMPRWQYLFYVTAWRYLLN